MTILDELVSEVAGMFVGDAPLAASVLVVIAVSAALIELAGLEPLIGGSVLVLGCPFLLIDNVRRSGRHRLDPKDV